MKSQDVERIIEENAGDILDKAFSSPNVKVGEEAQLEIRKMFSEMLGSESILSKEELYRKLVGGRPGLNLNQNKPAHTVGIRFPDEDIASLDKIAAEDNIKRSQVVREAVSQYLNKRLAS